MAKIIGIDLGTSNSAAAVVMGGKPTLIPAAEGTSIGGKAFPSVVAFTKEGQLLVGEPARRQAVTNPDSTIIAAKRKMGSDYVFKVQGKDYKPQQISSFILQKIKKDAEAFLGEKVEKAVITVPAYFDDNQRQATKDAGTIAGLDVVRIINEPTAASLAFGLDKAGQDMKILVFDLGGGTLDVTIMEMGGGVFEVLSTSGDTQLGGTDMDKVLIDYVVNEFRKTTGIDLEGETASAIKPKESWYEVDLATTGFGQGISVTPIGLLSAFSSIANNGIMMEPHVVGAVRDKNGKITRIRSKELAKPISSATAKVMTQVLVNAVNKGEAKFAKIKGYRVAGKTGTASIPVEGHYDPNKTIASFIGFAPADEPKFAMLVILDRPTTAIYGAETAAPVFFQIAQSLFTYFGIPPDE